MDFDIGLIISALAGVSASALYNFFHGRMGRLAVNRRERLTVVAALRNWAEAQDQAEAEEWPAWQIATHNGRIEALDAHEIDILADRLDWER